MNFRSFKAIFRKTFGRNGKGGAVASSTTFTTGLCFILVCMVFITNIIYGIFAYKKGFLMPKTVSVMLVNEPESFKAYRRDTKPNTQFVSITHDALYDFVTFDEEMHANDCFMTLAFPKDFDAKVHENEQCEILTYIRTDDHYFGDYHEVYMDLEIENYQNYLKWSLDIPLDKNTFNVNYVPTTTRTMRGAEYISYYGGTVMIPLVAFIVMLYIGMSKGTNAIAGQKEKGTLTGILLTPTPVTAITLGNLCGVWLSSLLPILLSSPLLLLPKTYRTPKGLIGYLLLSITLSLLIASITLLVSVLSDNIVSAQTAFLPVFFIFLAICVMCIQNRDTVSSLYLRLPVYGQFYGMGLCLTRGDISYADIIICCLTTILFSVICIVISDRLLRTERYTTTVDSLSDKKIAKQTLKEKKLVKKLNRKPKAVIFEYTPRKYKGAYKTLISHIRFPLIVLSLTQLLAFIPTLIDMSKKPELYDMIADLKNVTDMSGIFEAVFGAFELLMAQPLFLFLMGISYWVLIAVYLLKVKFIEKNPLYTTGLGQGASRAVKNYLIGIALGLVMFSSVVAFLLLTGTAKFTGFGLDPSKSYLFVFYILMWIPQGFSEELMFRGYMMPRLAPRFGKVWAVFISSLLFGVFHAANKGFTVLALINLILIAAAYALICLYTDSIFMTGAAHTVWNFSQGNLFGLEVSGNTAGASLIQTTYLDGKPSILTGGNFGPEGGIATTLVSVVTIVIVLLLLKRKASAQAVKN